jgi:phosphoribosylanthranilate isomerase
MFQIKICGITSAEDALVAAEAGASAIGLNFYDQSPRHIQPDVASDIVRAVREGYPPERLEIYGVFVNASVDDILWTLRDGDLYGVEQSVGIQLHGDEPPEFLAELKDQGLGRGQELLAAAGHAPLVQVVRAFRCRSAGLEEVESYLTLCRKFGALPHHVLLDAHDPAAYGGTGKSVDWEAVRRERAALLGLPLILAGGLTPDNVAQAIATARPDAVDVASGVETSPGKKDPAKVRHFIAEARRAFGALAGGQ